MRVLWYSTIKRFKKFKDLKGGEFKLHLYQGYWYTQRIMKILGLFQNFQTSRNIMKGVCIAYKQRPKTTSEKMVY